MAGVAKNSGAAHRSAFGPFVRSETLTLAINNVNFILCCLSLHLSFFLLFSFRLFTSQHHHSVGPTRKKTRALFNPSHSFAIKVSLAQCLVRSYGQELKGGTAADIIAIEHSQIKICCRILLTTSASSFHRNDRDTRMNNEHLSDIRSVGLGRVDFL